MILTVSTHDLIPIKSLLHSGVLPHKVVTLARVKAVLERWSECVGQEFAGKAIPERYDKKVLHVRVEGSVWLQELHLRKRAILEKLNALAGEEMFTDMRLFVGRSER